MVQLINEFFDLRVTGTPDNSDPTARELRILMQPDGTVRAYALQAYRDESGDERYAVVGPDGQQFMGQWIYDSVGAAWVRMLGDANGNAYRREYAPSALNPTPTIVDPYVLTNAWAIAWNPGGAASVIYKVEFEVFNITTAGVTFGVARDDAGGGGAAGNNEYWTAGAAEPLPRDGSSGRRGPFYMDGTDDVIAICSANASAKIEFFVNRVE